MNTRRDEQRIESCFMEEAMLPMNQSEPVIHIDAEIMGGTAVFVGTRVPFDTLLDYLKAGQPLSEFLEDFPPVTENRRSRP